MNEQRIIHSVYEVHQVEQLSSCISDSFNFLFIIDAPACEKSGYFYYICKNVSV